MRKSAVSFAALCLLATGAGLGTVQAAKDEVVVGGTLALSGRFSGDVKTFKTLMDNYAAMVNERGGIKIGGKARKLRFKIYDDNSNPGKARQLYERLITVDKVDLLIGPYSSPITFGASGVAEKHKVPFVAVEANATALYKRNFKWLLGVLASGELWSRNYFDMLKAEGKAKTVAFITQDHLHAKDVYNGAVKYAKKVGFNVVFDEVASPKITDFTSAITKMKAAKPDVIHISSFQPFAVTFVKQAVAQGLKPLEFHAIHHGKGFSSGVGPLGNKVTGEAYWMPGMTIGDVKFFAELLKRSGFTVGEYPWSAIRVPAMDVIVDALKRAGTLDRNKVIAALRATDIVTIGGRILFAANGSGTMNTIVTQIRGGKYHLVWPKGPGYPTTKHEY
ncbi:MAG: amino acid ABC transporter substrate-binding protein [Nitrospinota bacterium]